MIYRFTDTEIKKLLKNIVILVDTKEQENFHITDYFTKHKRKYKCKNLGEGDYSAYIAYNVETSKILESVGVHRDLYFTNEILIERKGHLDEVAGNLSTRKAKYDSFGNQIISENRERERFKFELTRIRNCNATLFLFIEDKNGNENIRKGNYRSEYSPEAFLGSLKSFEAEFKFAYKFLDKAVMGSEIFFTIYYHIRDSLKAGTIDKFLTLEEVEEVVGEN
jgi:hypothetical protein